MRIPLLLAQTSARLSCNLLISQLGAPWAFVALTIQELLDPVDSTTDILYVKATTMIAKQAQRAVAAPKVAIISPILLLIVPIILVYLGVPAIEGQSSRFLPH